MAKKKKEDEEFSDKAEAEEEENLYEEEGVEKELEEDEISPAEAGFMEGYDNPELIQCENCGRSFDLEKAIEREINGKTFLFCSKKCAEHFEKRKAID